MHQPLLERLRTAEGLPTIPHTAIEIIRITRDPNCSLEELASVAQGDPALAARILKTVNSPLFGLRNSVASLDHAVKLLGIRTVKVLALSLALVDALEGDRQEQGHEGFDYRMFWRQALCMAAGARLLAEHVDAWLKDEAFLAGLLADLGLLAAFHVDPEAFAKLRVAHDAGRWGEEDDERNALGVTHAQLSEALLSEWGLPDTLCEAIGGHQGDSDVPASSAATLTHILRIAGQLSRAMWYAEATGESLQKAREMVDHHFSIDSEAFDQIVDQLTETVRETARLFSIDIGEVPVAAELRQEAALRLAELSVQGEVDRREAESEARHSRRDVQRLEEQLSYALETATTDAVTHLPDRSAFDEHLAACLNPRQAEKNPVGLILVSLSHLREVDIRRGRAAGDAALCQVAESLSGVAGSKGQVFQFTEVEFAVVTTGLELDETSTLASTLCASVETVSIGDDGATLALEPKVGVACAHPSRKAMSLEEIIEAADVSLDNAKRDELDRSKIRAQSA